MKLLGEISGAFCFRKMDDKNGRLFDETEVKRCLQELPDSEDKWNAIALVEWAIEKRWCIEAEGEVR